MGENESKKHKELTEQIREAKEGSKNPIRFQLQLNEEQKTAKEMIMNNAITVLSGKAGSGKCLEKDYEISVEITEDLYKFLVEKNYL
jgi:predicted ribonuclease YlaK